MPRNEHLRRQRIERNWRQQDVADRLETALVTVQRWERGLQQPSAYYRVKLCTLFGKSAQQLGLLEESSPSEPAESKTTAEREASNAGQPDATLSTNIALWTVPHARNPHFTGRDDLLAQLTQQFSLQEAGQPTSIRLAALTQSYAIKGLGGVGKTQTAVEYAYRSHEQGRYTHTIWINAASEEAILTSFATLADLLPGFASSSETDQRKLVAALIRWLEQCEQPWLLIVDNADDLSFVPVYLPSRGNGNILFTTRASAVGSLASSIEVDCMGVMESTHLLLGRAQREASATDDEIDEATNIALALAQFPLALDQAGAYIEETGCSLHDYLQLYQQHQYALLARRGKQARNYPESVATTWSLSFQHVEQTNPAAAELLRLCAFLAPDHIPQELLTQGAAHWPLVLQQAVADPLAFNQLLETLLAFSLVKRLGEDQQLGIHRLVQVVQLERLSAEEQRQWAERIVLAVNTIFPRDPDNVASWPQCLRYLEQVQACDALIRQHRLLLSEAADVLNRAGTYLWECALYTLAEPLYLRALHIQEQALGQDHPEMVEPLTDLADLYERQGRYTEAEPLYQRALHIQEQALGPDHPDIVYPLSGLAILYERQGKYVEAKSLSRRALCIQEQALGPDHPHVVYPLNNLAVLYLDLGRYAEAEPLYQRSLRIQEQALGPDHLHVAYPLNGLAILYERQGRYAEAEPLYHRALRIREQALGPDHPHVAYPLNNLAALYSKQGKYAEAEPLYQRALLILEQQLGPEHPDVASPLNGLANLYTEQGKYAEAEPLFQQALRIREQQLGPEHPDTAKTMYDFARFREIQGNSEEACTWYTRALAIREQAFGAQHHDTTQTRARLIGLLHTMGQREEAAHLEAAQSE